jgi:hypothetical protein
MYPLNKLNVEIETLDGVKSVELCELTVKARMELISDPSKNNAYDGLRYARLDTEIMDNMGATSLEKLWVDYVNHFYPKTQSSDVDNEDVKKN